MKISVIKNHRFDRAAFMIYVDLDPVPETFHTPFSAYQRIQGILNQSGIRSYAPIVALASTTMPLNPKTGRKRVSFILFVDLDPTSSGPFHYKEDAQKTIRDIIEGQIKHYNPVVDLAPDHMQPSSIVGSSELV